MTRAFNQFYGAPERPFARQKIVEFTMIVVFLLFLALAVFGSSAAALIAQTGGRWLSFWSPGAQALAQVLGTLVALGAAFTLFVALFRVIPNAPLRLSDTWRGALLSTVLLMLILQIFPLYIRFFGGGFQSYKTLGLLLLLLTWFYLLARIIVVGAELNAFLRPVTWDQATSPTRPPSAVRTDTSSSTPLLIVGAIGVLLVLLWQGKRGTRASIQMRQRSRAP
jgi:membrane protein